ncbi:acyltransferase family protein [Paractinoplanes lichenicola]|uniref:Acyltransferase n=1 Tax=Paractinoplanes lichenicola TaxID=2802976 RepID=A0ABS1W5W5_9ACTN|nr:acyltransferase [Actinoplanes lichenicola]MBL7262130.1 acyltransferase [Actinoplanes lichenicola]
MTETTTAGVRPAAPAAVGRALHFRPDIEGLRAVAVVLVVLSHAGVPGVVGGYIGLDVFFVISGFLITSLMLREVRATGGLSLIDFYARRARRLLPTAALVLITTLLASYHWLGFRRGDEIAEDVAWSALFAANFRFVDGGIDHLASQSAVSPVQHFWSLAVLEQFSFVWPTVIVLLIWLGFRWAIGYWLAAAVAASLAYSVWSSDTWSSFSPATRAWELGAGCLLALVATRLDRIPHRVATVMAGVGLSLIVIAALSFDETTPFPGYAAGLPVIATVLVLAGRGDSVLGRRPLLWLGRRSYAFYLWHWPVLIIAEQAYGGPLPAGTRALLVLGSLGLAVMTYAGLENPIRRSAHLRRSHVLTLSLAAWLIVAPLAVVRWKTSHSPAAEPGRSAEYQPRLGAPAHAEP